MRISSPRKVGKFRTTRQNPVRTQVHIVASIFVIQDLSISRHQHGDRIGEQHHARCDGARGAIQPLMADTGVLQVHRIHQVMQGYVRIPAAQSGEKRSRQAAEGDHGASAKGAEKQVEPDHVRLEAIQRLDDADYAAWIIERPAAQN